MSAHGGARRRARSVGPIGATAAECDALVWLAGQAPPPVLPSDIGDPVLARAQECFWEWLGREAAARQDAASRARTGESASTIARRVGSHAKPVRVLCIDHPPPEIAAPIEGPIVGVLDHARRLRAAPLVELGVAAGVGRTLWDEPAESWVRVPADAGLPDRRYVALRIVGDSMIPLLHSGDVVLVDLDGEVTTGAVIVARAAADGGTEGYVVKRVSGTTASTLELSSLNPDYPSLTIPSDRRRILGPVLLRWCTHRATRSP